jgi:two-component system chemotaxis sensor kinase CheA
MNPDQVPQIFIVEGRERLADMEAALLGLDLVAVDAEAVNAIFRAAHTIKGSAGMFHLHHIVTFTHVVESVLDAVRDGRLTVDAELVSLLLACSDHIGVLIDAVAAGQLDAEQATELLGASLIERLRQYIGPAPTQPKTELVGMVIWDDDETLSSSDGASADHDQWHISLRFSHDVLRHGMDPLSFIRYLGKFGTISGIVTLPDAIPCAQQMDPEACYLGFEIAFQSEADKTAIENVFALVRDECSVRILPPHSRVAEYIRLIQELPEEAARLGEILVRCGTLTVHELDVALASQQASPAPAQPLGAILVEAGAVQPVVVDAALAKQQRVKDAKAQESGSIRVDADKLDALINLVGELIIAAARSETLARRMRSVEQLDCAATLSGLVEQVRDSALQLRMVKIGATFNRFQRVVHDVSRELGKGIRLVVNGEETELDKTVVERIADPLTHLVRNAIDHGIESPDVRRARGKPESGTVTLNAYHDSGSIVIEVSDDGGGLKRDKILAKAVERGLVEPGRVLSPGEIYGLVFEPGFSTADNVTNLSGRGVGMDVVKRNVVALRGSVSIESEEGLGTKVKVRLPLTLAIINGFLVGLGRSVFVVPLDMVEECVELSAAPGHDYANLRGRVLPFIRLRELFGIAAPAAQRENIVVVKHAGHTVGLVVDSLLGEFQTVIKPMSKLFNHVKCISGSSILGTGEVALILDVPALVRRASGTSSHIVGANGIRAAVG